MGWKQFVKAKLKNAGRKEKFKHNKVTLMAIHIFFAGFYEIKCVKQSKNKW